MKPLLDTHILIWWLQGDRRLPVRCRRAIAQAAKTRPLLVSDISLWEVAVLVDLGRLRLRLPLRDWLERAVSHPLVERVGISPAVAAEVAALPATFHRDPADRILVATARIHGATILTVDERIVTARLVPTLG